MVSKYFLNVVYGFFGFFSFMILRKKWSISYPISCVLQLIKKMNPSAAGFLCRHPFDKAVQQD